MRHLTPVFAPQTIRIMANGLFLASDRARLRILPFASLAMLVPLPATCIACRPADNGVDCCSAKVKAFSGDHARSCCLQHAESRDALPSCGPSCWQVDSDCSCCFKAPERNLPPTKLLPHFSNQLAIGGVAYLLSELHDDPLSASIVETAAPASPIPLRILHCSWQI
jgi:hypothetical protein